MKDNALALLCLCLLCVVVGALAIKAADIDRRVKALEQHLARSLGVMPDSLHKRLPL